MPNKNYQRGVRLEREVMQIFKKHGYSVARTAGSHSPFDVVLFKETEQLKRECRVLVLVQCKTHIQKMKGGKKNDRSNRKTD